MYEPDKSPIHLVRVSNSATGNVRPFEIEWNGRSYTIRSCSRLQQHKKGETVFTTFLATDGVETFECSLSADVYDSVVKYKT